MSLTEAFVNRMIQNQHSAIRSYVIYTVVIVAAGVVLLVFGPNMLAQEAAKIAMRAGGTLVAALGSVPINELIGRREKLNLFEEMRIQLQTGSSNQDDSEEADRKRMNEMLWQAMMRTALT